MTSLRSNRTGLPGFDIEFTGLPYCIGVIAGRIRKSCRTGNINRYDSVPCIALKRGALVMQGVTKAASIIVSIPIRTLFFQKQLIGGLMQGAIKG